VRLGVKLLLALAEGFVPGLRHVGDPALVERIEVGNHVLIALVERLQTGVVLVVVVRRKA
jgi:hypothetical protein